MLVSQTMCNEIKRRELTNFWQVWMEAFFTKHGGLRWRRSLFAPKGQGLQVKVMEAPGVSLISEELLHRFQISRARLLQHLKLILMLRFDGPRMIIGSNLCASQLDTHLSVFHLFCRGIRPYQARSLDHTHSVHIC